MRRLLSSAAVIAAFASPALAADLPSQKAPPVLVEPVPFFLWSGFYVGVESGGQWSRENGLWGDAARKGLSPYANDANGGVIGGYVGYNWQFSNLVVGLEGDANGIFGGSGATNTVYNSLGLNGNPVGVNLYSIDARETWNADIRARFGYAVDRALFYVAGGVAFGDVSMSYAGPLNVSSAPFLTETTQRVGWTIGAGLEYAFTNSIRGRVEYRHTDLGSRSFVEFPSSGGGNTDTIQFYSDTVLIGLTYAFGGPEPVIVAKY